MAINEKSLTKGQIRKLNALRKSLGDKIANKAFAQWMKEQPAKVVTAKRDHVADKLVKAIAGLAKDKSLNLGRKGYVVKRAKGKGAKGPPNDRKGRGRGKSGGGGMAARVDDIGEETMNDHYERVGRWPGGPLRSKRKW